MAVTLLPNFLGVNHSVHLVHSKLLNICLRHNLSQRRVLPVSYDLIIKSVKWLTSKSFDIDGISVKNIRPDSKELMFHLQLLFQMCLVRSIVPGSFFCGTVTSMWKRGKDTFACSTCRPITITCPLSNIFEYV